MNEQLQQRVNKMTQLFWDGTKNAQTKCHPSLVLVEKLRQLLKISHKKHHGGFAHPTKQGNSKMKKSFYRILLIIGLLVTANAQADNPWDNLYSMNSNQFSLTNINTIDTGAFSGASGLTNVNINAGDFNLQSNSTVISYNPNGLSLAENVTIQNIPNTSINIPMFSAAYIGDNAFSGISGIIAINQASGLANSQANQIAIGFGVQGATVTDNLLAYTVSQSAGNQADTNSDQWVGVSNTAFEQTSGVVQLNQAAGVDNSTANNFALRVESK